MDGSCLLDAHRAEHWRLGRRPEAAGNGREFLLSAGDVPAEYRAAQEGAAVFDETDRSLLEIEGPEALAFLHRLLANTVRTLEPGSGNRNLLLSAKGKVLFDMDLAARVDGALISLGPGRAAGLRETLDRYLFADKVKLVDRTVQHAPLALVGPRAREVAQAVLQSELPEGDHAWRSCRWRGAELVLTAQPIVGSMGWRLDAGPERAGELWRELRRAGARAAGWVARESLRVEAGWAEAEADVDENVYPQEARLERAFALDKGCYIGQEVVAKIDTYGGLNKRLVALALDGDDPVARGARLLQLEAGEWRDLGVVTSWAYSFALERGLVLGYVKRRHQSVGTEFCVAPPPAAGSAALFKPSESTLRATIVKLPLRAGALPPTGEFE